MWEVGKVEASALERRGEHAFREKGNRPRSKTGAQERRPPL